MLKKDDELVSGVPLISHRKAASPQTCRGSRTDSCGRSQPRSCSEAASRQIAALGEYELETRLLAFSYVVYVLRERLSGSAESHPTRETAELSLLRGKAL